MNELEKELNDYLEFSFSESVGEVDFLKIKEIILKFTDKLKIDLRILKNKSYDLIVKHLSTLEDRKYKVNVKNINDFLKFIEDNNDEDYIYFKLRKILGILNNKIIFFDKINLYKFDFDKNGFNECEFLETISFSKGSLKKDFKFHNCIFKNNLKFVDCKFKGRLEIINCEGFIQISSPKGLKNIKIWNNDKNKLSIKINNIKFDKEGDYFFGGKNIESIEFNSTTNLSDYFKINKLNGVILKFIGADLGKTTFNGVKINKLYLENATLNDCVFNGVEFPDDYKLEIEYKYKVEQEDKEGNIEIIEKVTDKLSNKQLKDSYRQLKFVMDKNGNHTEGNRFYEKEMDYYERELSEKGLSQEKIVLYFQKWISYYGKSWLAPIAWIIVLAFITDIINYCYVNNFFDCNEGFICKPIEFWKLFWNLLYPLYGLKKDYIDGLDNWLTFGFILYKTIYGILFWHLIIALKRTTKR